MFVDYFIKRPIFAIVCSLIFVLAGAISIPNLPVAQFPNIAPSQIRVSANYTGANAKVVESSVTIPLEQEINGTEGARYITSTSGNNGASSITVTLEPWRNADDAVLDIQNRVKRAEARLPDEVNRTGISVEKSSNALVMVFGFYAENNKYDKYFISNFVDRYIKDELLRVPGVSEVFVFGSRKYAMRVWLDPNKLAARKLSASDVVQSLREQNVQVAAGQIGQPPFEEGQAFQMSVRAKGRLLSKEEFEEIALKEGNDGTLVKIKDVAKVELGAEDYSSILRFNNNENTVGILINHLQNANTIEVDKNIRKKLEELRPTFPPGLNYGIAFSSAQFVEESMKEVVITLLLAILMVVLVIFFFIQSWRSTLIPAITIPVSLIGSFLFVKMFGFSINTLTLFGITLATGVVVDDAIVVLENISRYIHQKGMSPMKAASEAMKEISGAVIATSLVLMAVFIPVAMFPGTTGKLYEQFALTIVFTIIISTFNALTLSPALSALIIRKGEKKQGKAFDLINKFLHFTRVQYKSLLFKAFRKQTLVVILFLIFAGLAVFMYKIVPSSFVPQDDRGYFIVSIQAPAGSSLAHTSKVMARVEKVLLSDPEIRGLFAIAGFSFLGSGPNKAMLFPTLKPLKERPGKGKSSAVVIERVRPKLMSIPGAMVIPFAPPPIRGLGNFGGFEFYIKSEGANLSLDDLAKYNQQFIQAANKEKELVGVFSSFTANDPQLFIKVLRDRAKSLKVDLDEIFSTLQVFLGSIYVNDFDLMNRVYRVYAQADKQFRSEPNDIKTFYVRNADDKMIPLSNLISMEETVSPQNITHFNLFRSTSVNGSAMFGYSSGQALEAVDRVAKRVLPRGMSYEWAGIAREQLEAGNLALVIFFLGIVFVFLILSAQYESFVDPFIILLVVPLAILGGLVAQFARGLQNDVYCQIGLVMLVGLASKNSILIVEYANQLKAKGVKPIRAAISSALTRFRPILMTSFSFILGVLPLVFAQGAGSASRHSLGTAVFGGMFFSTILSLFVVPILYVIIVRSRDYFKLRFKRKVSRLT
ncbi:MAG: efflux RND transporter permease subunit [Candidatus Caenarcaniphilales bacterium]|nr:efflux RND transporter permease subunit [Candidatus Caenarcaniphilales bacterium]